MVGDGIFDFILDGCNCFMFCLTRFERCLASWGLDFDLPIGLVSYSCVGGNLCGLGSHMSYFHLDIVCGLVAVCSAQWHFGGVDVLFMAVMAQEGQVEGWRPSGSTTARPWEDDRGTRQTGSRCVHETVAKRMVTEAAFNRNANWRRATPNGLCVNEWFWDMVQHLPETQHAYG